MYEHMTFENILRRALARVPAGVDLRQGSIIYDSIAPAAAELAQAYIELDHILDITYAETAATGGHTEWLRKRCAEIGVHYYPASRAVRLGIFFTGPVNNRQPLDVPLGGRYTLSAADASAEARHYTVTERMDNGQYRLTCETPGIAGNQLYGRLIPEKNVPGLTYAELADVLIPGEEDETNAALYKRYEAAVNEQPYGGNIADYKRKVNAIEGMGGCRVYPVARGGGTVDIYIIAADFTPPSDTLVADVQEIIDPEPYHQLGRGLSPIGHWTLVHGVVGVPVNVTAQLQLKTGYTVGQVEEPINEAFIAYLHRLAEDWTDTYDPVEDEQPIGLTVRVSQVEARMLNVPGVVDVSGVMLNGLTGNLTLGKDEIPVPGTITLLPM